ncbi:MAG: hypothetical protein AAFZ15_03485 [Bacteroidota bacterium]
MKKSCTLFILFLMTINLFSQATDESARNLEVGVNATAFVSSLFGNTSFDDYLFTIKKHLKSDKTLRVGFGFNGSFLTDDPSSDDITNNTTITSFEFDLRVGAEKNIMTKGNWSIKLGFDGITGYFINTRKITQGKRIFQNYYLGLGPVTGIQYMINDRIGLLTEASFFTSISEIKDEEKSDSPTFDDKDKRTSINFGMRIPTNVIFFVNF